MSSGNYRSKEEHIEYLEKFSINQRYTKNDVERVIVYEKQDEIVIAKDSLEVNKPLKIES